MDGQQTPGSMLEVYMHAIAGRTNDDFLDRINMGVGNYSYAEYWQQVRAFRRGLFADAGMTRKLMAKARRQAKKAVVDAIYAENGDRAILARIGDTPDTDGLSKREYFEEHADDIWQSLGDEEYSQAEHQAWLVNQVTGLSMDWTPPHWRMLKMRHEASRSKDARLIDNLFGRPPEGPDMQALEEFE